MRVQDYFVAGSIASVYPVFIKKLVDVVMNEEKINELCPYTYGLDFDFRRADNSKNKDTEEAKCLKNKREKQRNINNYRYVITLCAGLVAIGLSYYFKDKSLSIGLGLAGLITIIMGTTMHWEYMNEKLKLGTLGLTLTALLFSPKFVNKFKNDFN
jgi:predicted histidine transporter YuiF (NhaC family)